MASFNPTKIANKQKRQAHNLKIKKQKESAKRDERLKRRRHEDKNPHLRERRREQNVPATIDSKRTWDEVDSGDEDAQLGLSVNILDPKRRRLDQTPAIEGEDKEADGDAVFDEEEEEDGEEEGDDDDERDSMLDSDSENEGDDSDPQSKGHEPPDRSASEAPSVAPSTATDLTVRPELLKARFPGLFEPSDKDPKVLLTTSINSTLHHEAELLVGLFPNSTYIRRTAHFHSYKYSVREICQYASSPERGYTHVVVLNEDEKRPKGLDIVPLPHGPMFHFSISNWIPGKKLPGHGNPTAHIPELILNGFRTPLGLLTAHLFKSVFPPRPELQGRQVITLHNQRDYIFVRRHRYVFRDKRGSEKSIQGADGKPMKGVEDIRAGLQELGPRFTLKLRRVDKGVQRASGQEWEWKAHDEKVRTRFSL